MLIPAMIFAGVTLLFGILFGYLLGAARARMSGEERLSEMEAARTALEARFNELRTQFEALRATLRQPPSASPPASGSSS